MIRVITRIKDLKLRVFYKKTHDFNTKKEFDDYKNRLINSINDKEVAVTFTTYVKER